MGDGSCTEEAREAISQKILNHAAKLAEMAENTAAMTEERLTPITTQCPKNTEDADKKTISSFYPPLFDELRGYLQTLERSLNSISSTINRVELP